MESAIKFILVVGGGICALILLSALIASPFMYLEGSAKSEYLRGAKGIEMAWYRSVFLPDTVFIDATLTTKSAK